MPEYVDSRSMDTTRFMLNLGFVTLIVLMLSLGLVGQFYLSEMKDTMHETVNRYAQKVKISSTMRDAVRQRTLILRKLVSSTDIFEQDSMLLEFYSIAGVFRDAREELLRVGLDPDEQLLETGIVEAVHVAQPLVRFAAELVLENPDAATRNQAFSQAEIAQNALLKILDDFVNLQDAKANQNVKHSTARYNEASVILQGMLLTVVLLGLVIAFFVSRFVTNRNEKLQTLNRELAETTQLKSEFMATMSHEIRTPMNGVIGMASLLSETKLDSFQTGYVDTIKNCGDNLLYLINDILDFSKIEAGKIDLEEVEFNFDAMVEDAMSLLAAKAQEKNLELIYQREEDVPILLEGDAGRLRQVIMNFVSNAVKFTERGEVLIRTSVRQRHETSVVLNVEIVDTGVGVSDDNRAKLFQAFTQVGGPDSSKGGSGLGLAICKKIIETMGGKVGVESKVGFGSQFWFTLPIKTKRLSLVPNLRQLESLSVLLVCANESNRMALIQALQAWGCRVADAINAVAAMKILEDDFFSENQKKLVIVDRDVGGYSGLELIRKIHSRYVHQNLKLFLMLPITDKAANKNDFCEVDEVITKPIRRRELREKLLGIMPQQGSQDKRMSSQQEKSNETSSSASHWNILVAEDNLVNQRVVEGMLKKLGYEVSVVGDGQAAVQALLKSNYDLVLMDCQMPVMDGYQATAEIRRFVNENQINPIPIVALTANALAGDREKCLASGMDDFLPKPIKLDILKAMIEKWCTNGNAMGQSSSA
ncbi:MAG: response regulator [Gammaproteobacteria bacterium]|nr:response regulator [Gammaproteobacteria bacterium]